MIPVSNRRTLPIGVPLEVNDKVVARLIADSIERADGTKTALPVKSDRTEFLGVDRQGRSYYIVGRPAPAPSSPSSHVYYLEAYDDAGTLLARDFHPYGDGGQQFGDEFLVSPLGGLIFLRFTNRGLAVSQLAVEQKH